MSQITAQKFNQIIQSELPWAADIGVQLLNIEAGWAELLLPYDRSSLRPGGTIAGPVMMLLADVCMYAVVLSEFGDIRLAVTSSLNINFLRKPGKCDLRAEGSKIKIGKRLAVIEVSIFSNEEIVAHATGTYSIPPQS